MLSKESVAVFSIERTHAHRGILTGLPVAGADAKASATMISSPSPGPSTRLGIGKGLQRKNMTPQRQEGRREGSENVRVAEARSQPMQPAGSGA